ncbi:hypothetical protein JW935_15215 [candidate division KSB1 bacterium]|nr:hypothetical protein [candidate division KSB1 bacterium]
MNHPSLQEWEEKLLKILDEIDDYLEENYGKKYKLHPVAPEAGKTASKAQDGLFRIHAHFSAGFGSKYGGGYVIDTTIATLEKVPKEFEKKIDQIVAEKLREKLPAYFPDNKLTVKKDGNVVKVFGDLSLGTL